MYFSVATHSAALHQGTLSNSCATLPQGMMDYIEVLDARTLLTKHTLRSYRDTLEWGLLSLGTRWLA